MFLIRSAFWLSLVILLIPADQKTDAGDQAGQPISAYEAYGAAQSAISDFAGFCARQPEACDTGGAALATFGNKARHGARLLYEFLDEQFGGTPTTTDTLTTEDRKAEWQGSDTEKQA